MLDAAWIAVCTSFKNPSSASCRKWLETWRRLYDRHLNCSVSAIPFDRDTPLESLVCQRTKPEAA
jgi:hypothetical protein